MRRGLRLLAALAALAAAPGCAAIPAAVAVGAMAAVPGDPDRAETAGPEEADPVMDAALDGPPSLEALDPQTLEPGQCGLFLFTRGEDSEFVFFAPGEGEAARIRLNGARLDLTRIAAASGETEAGAGEFTWRYAGAGGVAARLRARAGEVLPQGRRIPQASLRLTRPDGAAVVVPLTGLVACQAA